MPTDHERFMRLALEEAEKGKAEGNIAVGSVIVQGDTVVARDTIWSPPPLTPRRTRKPWHCV